MRLLEAGSRDPDELSSLTQLRDLQEPLVEFATGLGMEVQQVQRRLRRQGIHPGRRQAVHSERCGSFLHLMKPSVLFRANTKRPVLMLWWVVRSVSLRSIEERRGSMAEEIDAVATRRSIGRRRNPATEAAVLSAAREVLVERGYGGFTIDEVARRANAGKPIIISSAPVKRLSSA